MTSSKPKHLLSLNDLTPKELVRVLNAADKFKKHRGQPGAHKPLKDKSVAMIFTKSSTRTRVSFEVGVFEMGGNCLFLDSNALQVGRGESMADTAKVLNRYVHAVVIRCHQQSDLEEYARHSTIPVINALTNEYHPCQILADFQTIRETRGKLAGVRVAYLGDGDSNMSRSWAIGAKLAGLDLVIGAPKQYQLDLSILDKVPGTGTVTLTDDPVEAATDADILYTDVWVSMGFEDEATERLEVLKPYQVNAELMSKAKPDAKFMHCLPAYRGKEVTADVLDGPASIVYDEAENRIHAQKAVLARLTDI